MNPNEQQNPFNDQPSVDQNTEPTLPVTDVPPQNVEAVPVNPAQPAQAPQPAVFPGYAPAPVATSPNLSAQATPPKKSKKGLILGLAIGGGVLIAGLITLILILVMGGVSRQDYSDAQAKAKEMTSAYNKLSTVYVSSYDTSSAAATKLDTLKTNLSVLSTNAAELGGMKAIKKDQKAADFYKKLDTERADLEAYINVEIEYLDKIFPVVKEIDSVSYSDPDQTISTLKEYQGKLKALDLKQKVNKDYIDEINTILPQFIDAIEAYVSAMNAGNYDSSLYTKVSNLSSQLTDADTTWKDNLNDLYEAVEFSKSANDLGYYLTGKANGEE